MALEYLVQNSINIRDTDEKTNGKFCSTRSLKVFDTYVVDN